MRQVATERRLRTVQAELDLASRRHQAARRWHAARVADEHAVTAGCYDNPADEQGWIARTLQTAITTAAASEVDQSEAETSRCEAGRRAAALAVMRNEARQTLLNGQVAAGRRAATLRKEEEAADELPHSRTRRC
ncbi:hypothetical protein PK98_00160 [Croceibacterium mercuriale]|uniref:MobA/MobL protein domain-containing protein n=2 Tax=Croceibacterium mercuriale TaxID=1572751 RepID=A0A0B2BZU9_9SPHN|nr:hypothetical protein PK98_00160 [Croceibacterium mercuriale]